MAATPTVTVLDASGTVRETLELASAVFGGGAHGPLLHQAVVRELAGRRTGTHDTRGRSEVSGGGRKPWRQKGTGRARQGSIRATQWKGGGKPFGPTPRRYDQAMPRQARRAALRSALASKVTDGQVTVVDEVRLVEAKTRALIRLLTGLGLPAVPTLVIVSEPDAGLERASRNVPWIRLARPGEVSVAGVLRHQRLVFERQALLALQEALRP
jgi:large subunit ribosomal protein L4